MMKSFIFAIVLLAGVTSSARLMAEVLVSTAEVFLGKPTSLMSGKSWKSDAHGLYEVESIDNEHDLKIDTLDGKYYKFHSKLTTIRQEGGLVVGVHVWPMITPKTYDQTVDELAATMRTFGVDQTDHAKRALAKFRGTFGRKASPSFELTPGYYITFDVRPKLGEPTTSRDAVWYLSFNISKK